MCGASSPTSRQRVIRQPAFGLCVAAALVCLVPLRQLRPSHSVVRVGFVAGANCGYCAAMGLQLSAYERIVVLTGAGVSVASGLPTYRGPGGLWRDEQVAALATVDALEARPNEAWALWSEMRHRALSAQPNAAHRALALAEARMKVGGQFTLITQNVDGLHQRAGSRNVIDYHGSLLQSRCSAAACSSPSFDDDAPPQKTAPLCRVCSQPLRPDVVLFGELIGAQEHLAKRALRDCDLFLAIGTSGTVSPASNMVRAAEYAGAHTVFINLEPMEPPNPSFRETILGRAEEILPRLVGEEAV